MSKLELKLMGSTTVERYSIGNECKCMDGCEAFMLNNRPDVMEALRNKGIILYNIDQFLVHDEPGNEITKVLEFKHEDTNTTIMYELSTSDHDGNPLYLESKPELNIDDESINISNVYSFIQALVKYGTKPEYDIDNNTIIFEPSETNWFEGNEKYDNLLDNGKCNTILELVIGEFKGKIVHLEMDYCGGVIKLNELKSTDEVKQPMVTIGTVI